MLVPLLGATLIDTSINSECPFSSRFRVSLNLRDENLSHTELFWLDTIKLQGKSYQVFWNVNDFGAKGGGSTLAIKCVTLKRLNLF